MTEHCPDHHTFVQTVGSINGKIDLLLSGQQSVKNDIGELFGKFNSLNVDTAVQKTKATPIYIVIGLIAAAIVTVSVNSLWNKVFDHQTQQKIEQVKK